MRSLFHLLSRWSQRDDTGWRPICTIFLLYLSSIPFLLVLSLGGTPDNALGTAVTVLAALSTMASFCIAVSVGAQRLGYGDLFGFAGLLRSALGSPQAKDGCNDASNTNQEQHYSNHNAQDRAPSSLCAVEEGQKNVTANDHHYDAENNKADEFQGFRHLWHLLPTESELVSIFARRKDPDGVR